MNKILLIISLILLISACDRNGNSNAVIEIYRTDVYSALSNYDAELTKARNQLGFEDGSSVSHCDGYIKASQTSRIGEGVNNMIIRDEYLMCDVLALVGKSRKLQVKDKSEYTEALANKLDLKSFRSSLRPRMDDKTRTLAKLVTLPDKLVIDGEKVSIVSDNWHFALVHVASGDINNNGKPDWIIWVVDEAKVGNYRGYDTLVAYDVDLGEGLIRAKVF